MSHHLTDCWAKVRRAEEHVQSLKRNFGREWGEGNTQPPVGLRKDFHPKTSHFVFRVSDVPTIPVEWSLQIGDALHNFRGALDHLAWYLVQTGDDRNPKRPTLIQFPIYSSPASFDERIDERLPGVDSHKRAIIKAYQPYGRWKALGKLATLSNEDKHRTIHTTVLAHTGLQLEVAGTPSDFQIEEWQFLSGVGRPLQTGAKLFRCCGQVTGPNPDMNVNLKGDISIAFEDGSWVTETLDWVGATVKIVLHRFEREYEIAGQ